MEHAVGYIPVAATEPSHLGAEISTEPIATRPPALNPLEYMEYGWVIVEYRPSNHADIAFDAAAFPVLSQPFHAFLTLQTFRSPSLNVYVTTQSAPCNVPVRHILRIRTCNV